MARIRTLKPEFFRSRSLARCPRDARITFAGLWTEADDKGRGVADPRILKGALWALDDDITHLHVSSHLDVLVATGHIRLYESAGETYYEVVNFGEHQAAAYRRGEPKYPAPETYLEGASHVDVQESAGGTRESAGREGNVEGKGTGNEEGSVERTRKRARSPETPIPPDWQPTDGHKSLAQEQGIDLDHEAAKFRDHAAANDRRQRDWDASFRTWIRRARDYGAGNQPPNGRAPLRAVGQHQHEDGTF